MYIGWPNCGPSGTDYLKRSTLTTGMPGLRGLGCGCGCSGGYGQRGLGQSMTVTPSGSTLTNPLAMITALPSSGGLFSSGWDLSGWSWMEWGVVLVGFYVVFSVFSTSRRAGRRVGKSYRRIASSGQRRRKAKAEDLRRQARLLEGDDFGPRRRRPAF